MNYKQSFMDNPNLIQSDQQNPERDSTGETSLAKLSIEEDRGANSPAVSIVNFLSFPFLSFLSFLSFPFFPFFFLRWRNKLK